MKAIDVHVHPSTSNFMIDSYGSYRDALSKFFRTDLPVRTPEEMVEEFRELDIKAVLLGWDAETAMGLPPVPNDFIAKIVRDYPDTFIGFGGVDPWKGKAAIKEIERCAKELGFIGLKFMPAAQAFFPDDRQFYPMWAKCQELGLVVLTHVGTTGMGAGTPGGMGVRLKYVRPIHIDDVATDFPELTIICAHPAWPWLDEMMAIAQHKDNVYLDLSGWSPKYFPPTLVRDINSRFQDKCLFGSDYPYVHPKRWLQDFETLDLKPEVKQKVLLGNARKVLKLV